MHPLRALLAPLAVAVMLATPVPGDAQPASGSSANGRAPALSAEAVLLLDPAGRVLYEKNADAERAPASLVKLMTMYLACEDIEAGRADPEELVTISATAALTPRFRLGLRPGDQVPLRALLEGVAIASANDAATAVAERLAGDEAAFVLRMNDKGRELGLTGTRFANAHGLPDPAQRSNARDLAVLTAWLLHDCPSARLLLGGQTFVYGGRVYARHVPLFDDPGGVQALKTGFTKEAGYNLAVSAWKAGQQFVMILLGARSRAQSFLDAKRLLQYGFVETGLETEEPKPTPVRRPTVRARRTGARP